MTEQKQKQKYKTSVSVFSQEMYFNIVKMNKFRVRAIFLGFLTKTIFFLLANKVNHENTHKYIGCKCVPNLKMMLEFRNRTVYITVYWNTKHQILVLDYINTLYCDWDTRLCGMFLYKKQSCINSKKGSGIWITNKYIQSCCYPTI